MNRCEIDVEARQDLRAIYEYIACDSRRKARRMMVRQRDRFKLLAANPEMGESRDDLMPGLRCVTIGNYVVFFRATKRGVDIVRVIHGARDFDELF